MSPRGRMSVRGPPDERRSGICNQWQLALPREVGTAACAMAACRPVRCKSAVS